MRTLITMFIMCKMCMFYLRNVIFSVFWHSFEKVEHFELKKWTQIIYPQGPWNIQLSMEVIIRCYATQKLWKIEGRDFFLQKKTHPSIMKSHFLVEQFL